MITVLLVHDNTEVIDNTRAYLEKMGEIRVDVVPSTKQALETLKRRTYDIIISYYRLPEVDGIEFLADMTGIELLRVLKSQGNATPFILYHWKDRETLVLEDMNSAVETALQRGGSRSPVPEMRDMIYQAVLRKKAERDQNLRCELLSTILSATPLWVCQLKNGSFEWVNPVMSQGLGYEDGFLTGKNAAIVFPGREEYDHTMREMALRTDGLGWGRTDSRMKRKDGTMVPCRLRIRLLDPKDPARGQVMACEDLTDQVKLQEAIKESDLRYREFLNNSASLIMKLDTEGNVTFFNKNAQAFFGYSEAEITGKSLVETIIPLRAGRNAGGFVPDMALNTDGTSLRIHEMVLRDGEQVWVAWTNTSIRDPDGHISEYVCIGHDITDHTHRDRRRISTALWRDKVISGTDVKEEVFEAVLNLGLEISKEGREGHQIGTAFVIGDIENVLKESRQLVINPFRGEELLITNHEIKEMVKEFTLLDGAFLVRGDGRIHAAGSQITTDTSKVSIPQGLGTRHRSVAAITLATKAVGIVVSQSGGRVSIFRNGQVLQEISPGG